VVNGLFGGKLPVEEGRELETEVGLRVVQAVEKKRDWI
jgi:hypothetical protein